MKPEDYDFPVFLDRIQTLKVSRYPCCKLSGGLMGFVESKSSPNLGDAGAATTICPQRTPGEVGYRKICDHSDKMV